MLFATVLLLLMHTATVILTAKMAFLQWRYRKREWCSDCCRQLHVMPIDEDSNGGCYDAVSAAASLSIVLPPSMTKSVSYMSSTSNSSYSTSNTSNVGYFHLTVRNSVTKLIQNSCKTVLKLFCFSQNETPPPWHILAVLSKRCQYS